MRTDYAVSIGPVLFLKETGPVSSPSQGTLERIKAEIQETWVQGFGSATFSHLTSLGLCFLICKMDVIIKSSSQTGLGMINSVIAWMAFTNDSHAINVRLQIMN